VRIISGSARGRRLFSPSGQSLAIRPTADRAREALFSIIGRRTENAAVLDLYAGTGALGLEAFSRGARCVTFVDHSRQALELITRNIIACTASKAEQAAGRIPPQLARRFNLIYCDLRRGLPLSQIRRQDLAPFDLVFLDPPYSMELCRHTLDDWDRDNLLATDGLLVAEERASEDLEGHRATLETIDRRVYGDTAFWFFKRRQPDNPQILTT